MILRNHEFEAALFDHPDDDAAWAIYGDWLAAHGDTRGEIIQLELAIAAGDRSPALCSRYAKLMVEEHPRWVGAPLQAMLDEVDASRTLTVEWRRGHLLDAQILAPGSQAAAARLSALLGSPTAMMLERIFVSIDADRDDRVALDPEIWQQTQLGALRQLTLDAWTFRRAGPALIDLAFDWDRAWPRLEVLRLHAAHWRLSPPRLVRLRKLELSTRHGVELEPLRMLALAELPALEHLALFFGRLAPEDHDELSESSPPGREFADILADIFAMAGRSAVVRLALVALDQPEILLAQLGKARALLDQLERLYLGWGLLGDEHVAALAELLGRCPRLREVDVGGNYLGELGVAALRAALGSGVRVDGLADQKADRGRADRQIPIFGRYGIAEDHYDTWDDAD